MKKICNIIILSIIAVVLISCGSNTSHEGEAKTPSGSKIQKGRNYQDVNDDFLKNGFTNIQLVTIEDLLTGWMTKDGEVEEVSVDGDENYSPDKWYENDVEVVITYHTFPQTKSSEADQETVDEENLTIETNSSEIETTIDETEEVLTPENNEELAELILVKDVSDPIIQKFADKYEGRTIEFDGNVAYINNHGSYDTRYDILLGTGDYDEHSQQGPSFQLKDVGVTDLGMTGAYLDQIIKIGDNFHMTAVVGKYNAETTIFLLDPVTFELKNS